MSQLCLSLLSRTHPLPKSASFTCSRRRSIPEFAQSTYNDAFGFFITGQNPLGGNYSDTNYALLPGTSTPVSINNVNATTNATYYVSNNGVAAPGTTLDGQTTAMGAVARIVAGQSYSVSFAIADIIDASHNSAVFINYFGASLLLDLDANNSSGAIGQDYQTTYMAGGAARAIVDTDAKITNFDQATDIQSATVTLTNAKAGDALNIGTLPGGITAVTDTSVAGVIKVTLTGNLSEANYETALKAITFSNSGATPDGSDRIIKIKVNDGDTDSGAATSTIHINNATPTVDLDATGAGTGWTRTYTENGAAVAIADTDASVMDPDDTNMESAAINISNAQAGDRLLVNGSSAASGVLASGIAWTRTDSTVLLSGTFTKAQYASALALVTFENTGNNPGSTVRYVNVTVNDGTVVSNTAVATINVTPVNDAPVAVADTASTAADAPVTFDVRTNDSDPESAALAVTQVNGTTLITGTPVAVTGGSVVRNTDGTLTFTPTAGYTGSPTFNYTLSDGSLTSTATVTLTVSHRPIVDLNSTPAGSPSSGTTTSNLVTGGGFGTTAQAGAPAGWTEGGNNAAGAVVLNGANGRWDWTASPSATLTQAITVPAPTSNTTTTANSSIVVTTSDAISSVSFDLAWQNQDTNRANTVTVSYGGTLYATFTTGQAGTTGTWAYSNGASGPPTTIAVANEVTDGLAAVTITLPAGVIASANLVFTYAAGTGAGTNHDDIAIDNVVVTSTRTTVTTTTTADTADNNWATTYTENGAAVSITDTDSSVWDSDNTNMTSAVITLTNPQTGDRLLVGGSSAASGTLPSGIAWTRTDSLVTLSGSFSKADYADAIEAIQFENTGHTPGTVVRTINVTVSDGVSTSAAAVATINVTEVNDRPDIAAPGSISVIEDVSSPLTGILFSDVDLGAAAVVATLSVPSGALTAVSGGGVAVGGTSSSLTLTGTVADINAFIAASNVAFTAATNATATVTLTATINDQGNTGIDPGTSGTAASEERSTTVTLNVTAVNDAPVNTLPATFATNEDTSLSLAGLVIADVDVASGTMTVTLNVGSGTLTRRWRAPAGRHAERQPFAGKLVERADDALDLEAAEKGRITGPPVAEADPRVVEAGIDPRIDLQPIDQLGSAITLKEISHFAPTSRVRIRPGRLASPNLPPGRVSWLGNYTGIAAFYRGLPACDTVPLMV